MTTTPTTADDTLNSLFQATAERCANRVALRHKVNKIYQDITYRELAEQVETVASALVTLGVECEDRVAILSENRPEWAIMDLAALSLGAIIVPIYPTLPTAQVAYIVKNSGAKVIAIDGKKQQPKIEEARQASSDVQHCISFEPLEDAENFHSFADILAMGRQHPLGTDGHKLRWSAVNPDNVASLVYTSGTTGDPKGAMLTHHNFVWDVDASLAHYADGGESITEEDCFFSFLPLSHAYERTTGYYLPIRVGASIGYNESLRSLADDMAAVKPTLMVCVPRVYEAMQERVMDAVSKREPADQKKFNDALEAGIAWATKKMAGEHIGLIESGKRAVLDKFAYSQVRERFGGRLRFLVSGGAALNPDTARFFAAIGIPISEGYGMTEASPVMSTNPVHRSKVQTVGTVLPGAEFKIAEDGEILYRGPNIMKGYWHNDEATKEVIDGDGWLHTGDVGQLDGDGYLKITDRKKDIIVLANGKNVAPQQIEAVLKRSPFITEVVLIGDKQSIITALVIPDKSKLTEWAKEQSLTFADYDALLALPEAKRKIKQEIDAQSSGLAEFEKVKKFTLLDTTFSVDSGELTPSLKVKRKVVFQKFAPQIAAMRGGDEG